MEVKGVFLLGGILESSTIAEQFGAEVAELVDGVSKLTRIEFISRAEVQAENFRKMVLAMARDIRVIHDQGKALFLLMIGLSQSSAL